MSMPEFQSWPDVLPPLEQEPPPPPLPPPPPSTAERHELTELIAEAVHQMSHAVHQIAADLHALRVKVDALAPVAEGLARGGRLGAWSASRAARKDGGTPT